MMNRKKLHFLRLSLLVFLVTLASGPAWAVANDKTIPASQKVGRHAEVEVIAIDPPTKAPKVSAGKRVEVQVTPHEYNEEVGMAPGIKRGEAVPLPKAGLNSENQGMSEAKRNKRVKWQVVPGEPVDKTKTVPARYQSGILGTPKQGHGYVGQGQAVQK